MSNMGEVLSAIEQGINCLPEISKYTGLSEQSVLSAIKNLRFSGSIEIDHHRSLGRHKGRLPSIYRVKQVKKTTARVNSVFQLGMI